MSESQTKAGNQEFKCLNESNESHESNVSHESNESHELCKSSEMVSVDPCAHPSIAAARVFGLAQAILLQNLKGFNENKKMGPFLK